MLNSTLKRSLLSSLFILGCLSSQAKDNKNATGVAAVANVKNYRTFTTRTTVPSKEWLEVNADATNHPDGTFVLADLPAANAVEVISKRTRDSRYFVNAGDRKQFWMDKSSGDLNYQKDGQWLAVDARLMPKSANVFEASHQQYPVGVDISLRSTYIKSDLGKISFNKWELIGEQNGAKTKLANANWSNYTVGDDGTYITDIFPGIDAEMTVRQGKIKTNFIVRQNMFPVYDQLIFRDKFEAQQAGALVFAGSQVGTKGIGDVKFKANGTNLLLIEKGIAFGEKGINGIKDLEYELSANQLSFKVSRAFINSELVGGAKLIIDPTVAVLGTLPLASITGSMNCGSATNSCDYNLSVTPPSGATIIKVYNRFSMYMSSPANVGNGAFGVRVNGGCAYTYAIPGNTLTNIAFGTKDTGSTAIGFDSVQSIARPCIPGPSCNPAPIVFTLRLWNTYCAAGPAGCSNVYGRANEAFVVRLVGTTVDFAANRITRSSPTQSVCIGQNITLSRPNLVGGILPYSYEWLPGGQTTPTITVSPNTTTTYTSIVRDSCGTTLTDTTTLFIVNNLIPPAVVSPLNVCQFDNTPLTAVGTNLRWFTTATGGVGSPVAPIPPTVPGTYSYFVSSNGQCGESPRARLTIVVIAKPAPPTVTSPVGVCQYAQIQLSANGQNLKWYETETGGFSQPTLIPNTSYVDSYYYYVTQTINGCESDRSRIRLFVNYKPNGIVLPSRLFVCEGDTALFNYYGNALPDAVYNWSTSRPGNEIIFGQGTPGPMIVRFDSAGLRQVNIQINNKGCVSEIGTQTITVRPNPRITYNVQENVCQGQILNVALNAVSPLIDSFKYIFPGGNIVYGANSGGPYGVVYNNPGNFIIGSTSYSRTCPSRVYYDTIAVRPLADARITPNRTDICAGDSILFRASGIPDSNTQYYWTPNNFFSTGNIYQSWGVVKAAGYVKLRAVSQYGCVGQDSVLIDAKVCCEMYFPNAFSPNNDGKNDIFKPVTNGHQDIKNFRVLNRWGQVVYETREDRAGWNGVYNGRDQDAGTYYYYIRYNCRDGKDDIEQKGEVLLLR